MVFYFDDIDIVINARWSVVTALLRSRKFFEIMTVFFTYCTPFLDANRSSYGILRITLFMKIAERDVLTV